MRVGDKKRSRGVFFPSIRAFVVRIGNPTELFDCSGLCRCAGVVLTILTVIVDGKDSGVLRVIEFGK